MGEINSLFKRLYQLIGDRDRNHLEDYLTEIFAEVLQREDIFRDFLITRLGLEVSGTIAIKEVTTQKTYNKQDNHATDSRPDIKIRFAAGTTSHVLFIENKLDSFEGNLQLRRYADHLKSYESDGCLTHLVYITKGHDPKNKIIDTGTNTTFHQLRWFQRIPPRGNGCGNQGQLQCRCL